MTRPVWDRVVSGFLEFDVPAIGASSHHIRFSAQSPRLAWGSHDFFWELSLNCGLSQKVISQRTRQSHLQQHNG
jgi:hypothetical protein